MVCSRRRLLVAMLGVAAAALAIAAAPEHVLAAAGRQQAAAPANASIVIDAAQCVAGKVGASVPVSAIGEPVSAVVLQPPAWVAATATTPAHCRVDGVMAPFDRSPTARDINFRVVLPAVWSGRAVQLGGGGMNGVIPNLTGSEPSIEGQSVLRHGFATYGSDSGHQGGFGRRGAGPEPPQDWALNDEAIRNLGFMQLKKTHDAAMVIMARVYGERPRRSYFVGTSQGGREALTVTQRYAADYDGIIANVPIVSFSTLMLAPELIRIQEKPLAAWVTPAKVTVIRSEFIRQCDALDGLADGVINNYVACRARFDGTGATSAQGAWRDRRCPGGVDPNPADTTAGACLTDGQIATLALVYSRYRFSTPLAHGTTTFGMWVPNTDPSGSGLILPTRFRGQEGAAPDAPMHAHLGVLGVTGFLMQSLSANPLDYVEGGIFNARRVELSAILDSTNPDLSAFARRGGRMIVTIGTNDTLASSGAQLDYYQAVIDRMGQAEVDRFARLFVIPQAGHGLTGTSHDTAGDGRAVTPTPIPNAYDRFGVLVAWVERNVTPPRSLMVTAGARSLPLCSYPTYPAYRGGDPALAASYTCARP